MKNRKDAPHSCDTPKTTTAATTETQSGINNLIHSK